MPGQPLTKTSATITATRITFQTPTPYPIVSARLTQSINKDPTATDFPTVAREAFAHATPTAHFASLVNARVGPHDFMQFWAVNHGAWLGAYYPNTVLAADGRKLQSQRFILGNPLIAITMLEHDLDAGLAVPVELLLTEEEGGGTRCVYQLPSGLVAGYEGASGELKRAAEVLDGKLEALVRDVMRVES